MKTHLVIPGLLGYLPRLRELGELPRFPQIERLLARADLKSAQPDYFRTLFDLHGLEMQGKADLPTAALCYHAEQGVERLPDAYLFHADPIHLRPDQDRLLAFDFTHSPLDEADAAQFADAFNQHFAEDGIRLLTPDASRWYLSVSAMPDLRTRPLYEVLGRNIDFFLPQGPDAGYWRSWMNELQMLFYTLPVNASREAEGQLPVSSLWLSGGGVLPSTALKGFSQREGDCIFLTGLEALCAEKNDAYLVVEHAPGRAVLDADSEAWLAAVKRIDVRLADMLDQDLVLYPCEGRAWHWQAKMHRRFWQRTKPFAHWIATEGESVDQIL